MIAYMIETQKSKCANISYVNLANLTQDAKLNSVYILIQQVTSRERNPI